MFYEVMWWDFLVLLKDHVIFLLNDTYDLQLTARASKTGYCNTAIALHFPPTCSICLQTILTFDLLIKIVASETRFWEQGQQFISLCPLMV